MRRTRTLFGDTRQPVGEAVELTLQSLQHYGERYQHWAVAWSGGKDSTTLVTLLIWAIEAGQLRRPETLTILYADTRMELLPLWVAAKEIRAAISERGFDVRTVMAPMDERLLVYMLGRGVPPPNNNTLRWCTSQIKVEPMQAAIEQLVGERREKVLCLTGVRVGESAARDDRITLSCSRNGSECGQGWFQETLPESLCDTLAPILHWRVCNVWDWLKVFAPQKGYGAWPTALLADAYGGEEAQEINARTGCVGCPLASRDTALDAIIAMPAWEYLRPLKGLRSVYEQLRLPHNRLRKSGGEHRKDGTLSANQNRMGPITLEARRWAVRQILEIQAECNQAARQLGRPLVDILDAEEVARIRELIEAGTWPQKWTGDEPRADLPFIAWNADGSRQPLLPIMEDDQ